MANDIRQTLKEVNNYREFEAAMKNLGYAVIKGRGLSFIDDKKVKTKGSEVGFSLSKVEKILALKNELAVKKAKEQIIQVAQKQVEKQANTTSVPGSVRGQKEQNKSPYQYHDKAIGLLEKTIGELLKHTPTYSPMPYELTQEGYEQRKRKEKAQSLSR